jgi:uridine monophosphate synthetase
MNFFDSLEAIVRSKGSCLCVGLDPRVDVASPDPARAIVAANRRLIEATAPYAACYKPNSAFYEVHGPAGLAALEETLSLVPEGIPVILDAKRCDIDATAEAYARAIFGRLPVDAVTLSPYMGRDAVDPFLAYEGRGVFVLCRTSNRSAPAFQDLVLREDGRNRPLYLEVAREACSWSPSVGLVVAGNDSAALRATREAAPGAWFLAPGVGAQGGKADEAFAAGRREDGLGILVVASRSVAEAADPAAAARTLRDDMNAARDSGRRVLGTGFAAAKDDGRDLKAAFLKALVRTECFRLGEFTLKSGKKSPFYIDLRRLVSDPGVLSLAGEAYAKTAEGLDFKRIAGIPAAALPLATAACLRIGVPMIWPRMPVKDHGTGNRVEGDYARGERILLLDDLITTGASKLEAVEILRAEGLVVEDLAVLIERGRQGRADMEARGIRLHAFAHVRELFAVCETLGLVDAARRAELEAFVDAE